MQPRSRPDFQPADFEAADLQECDIVMKGGIASGLVYPYAVLEIATRYRFRSLGGTSVGAIAAAMAAAAEYGRAKDGTGRSFACLKRYCEELPKKLESLFQPDPDLRGIQRLFQRAAGTKSDTPAAQRALKAVAAVALLIGLFTGFVAFAVFELSGTSRFWQFGVPALAGTAAVLIIALFAWLRFVRPAVRAMSPQRMFGLCSGLTQAKDGSLGLTDWLHAALQDIAFGDPSHETPLTFGDLASAKPSIDLQMVTTNLSQMRPHTLPEIHLVAGFKVDEWATLFPGSVLNHLKAKCATWKLFDQALRFPEPADMPVIVATRMSLSFPVLFKAIPVYTEDFELAKILDELDGPQENRKPEIRQLWFSDGGISSNFPIHMFDSPLPSRPTFAISLDDLPPEARGENRVRLPQDAGSGALGVPAVPIMGAKTFAAQVFYSAKDWQDQLLSEITGQRERIAHVYLKAGEGGLNLKMDTKDSKKLMDFGWQAGRTFTGGAFDFDEHRWRRMLALCKSGTLWLGKADTTWAAGGFGSWFRGYAPNAQTYTQISKADRKKMADWLDAVLKTGIATSVSPKALDRFPQKTGELRNRPTY